MSRVQGSRPRSRSQEDSRGITCAHCPVLMTGTLTGLLDLTYLWRGHLWLCCKIRSCIAISLTVPDPPNPWVPLMRSSSGLSAPYPKLDPWRRWLGGESLLTAAGAPSSGHGTRIPGGRVHRLTETYGSQFRLFSSVPSTPLPAPSPRAGPHIPPNFFPDQ